MTSSDDLSLIKTSEPKEYGRIISIDMLRGLMLVIMTFDHLGGLIKNITFEPLGFVSAAAGFIYLSGYIYGVVYTRTLLRLDFRSLKIKSAKRSGVIYFYHFLVLLLVSVPMILNIWHFDELNMFREQPGKSIILFAFFLLQPENMDILPMYAIFVILGPVLIKAFHNGRAKLVFVVSLVMWILGQWPVFQYSDNSKMIQSGLMLGHFNLFCWQLLFTAGCFLGYMKTTGKFKVPISRKFVYPSLVAAILFIVVRYSDSNNLIFKAVIHFSGRDILGITRLVNFTVIAYLIYVLTIKNDKLFKLKWLSLLGRNSLQVFAYSVILIYFYSLLIPIIKNQTVWIEVVIHILLVASLTIPAVLHQTAVKIPWFKSSGL